MCDRDAPREIPSMQVRSFDAAVSDLLDSLLQSHDIHAVGDEQDSSLHTSMHHALKQQKVSRPVTVHSSLAAISAVCNEVVAMDQQTDHTFSKSYQKQKSDTNTPPIWVPTPKTGIPTHRPIDRPRTFAGDIDDRMIHSKIFK